MKNLANTHTHTHTRVRAHTHTHTYNTHTHTHIYIYIQRVPKMYTHLKKGNCSKIVIHNLYR